MIVSYLTSLPDRDKKKTRVLVLTRMLCTGQTFYRVKGEDSCEGILQKHGGMFDMRQL